MTTGVDRDVAMMDADEFDLALNDVLREHGAST